MTARVGRITVTGLFGRLNHDVHLKVDRVTLLHGPNGVGKTTLLRLTHALLSGEPEALRVPMTGMTLTFRDGRAMSGPPFPRLPDAPTALLLDADRRLPRPQSGPPVPNAAARQSELLDRLHARLGKRLRFDPEQGLVFVDRRGTPLTTRDLSAGEQRLLVLLHDPLLRAPPGALLLIDEPERSLHLGWQRQLLPVLLELTAALDLDAVLATHSPFVVGDRADLLAPLTEPA